MGNEALVEINLSIERFNLMESRRTFPRPFILRLLFERWWVWLAGKLFLRKKPLLTHPNHLRKFYGANLAEVFRTPLYDCSLKNAHGVPDFALTRLKGGPMEMWAAGLFDYLHYYVSRDLLDRVATDNNIAPIDSFPMFERGVYLLCEEVA